MKNLKSMIVLALIAIAITSCKNTEQERAKKSVDDYTIYIDSVSNVALADASLQWNRIERSAEAKKNEAEYDLQAINDKAAYQRQIEASSKKYDTFKQDVITEKQKADAANAKQTTRNSLFKNAKIGDDLNFAWVNKDNILSVYDHFVTTAIDRKDSYSREEWDEIKILYEALDNRKNTVENEGLTTADNLKIAALKIKFAPIYKINRMGAKAEENKEAKE